ncbi:30S ribosomal protein S20 [bacterium HR23]|nr:30S ribosomal protein S20 [bacterium HR23]
MTTEQTQQEQRPKKRRSSAERAAAKAERRRLRNRPIRTRFRTFIKRARLALASGDVAQAASAGREAQRVADWAAQKGVIHTNTAGRYNSRLQLALNALKARAGVQANPS